MEASECALVRKTVPAFAWRTDELKKNLASVAVLWSEICSERLPEDETEVLFTPLRHSVPFRYRVMQLPSVQLYEKQPRPALFLVRPTINLNYRTTSDAFLPCCLCSSLKTVAIFVVFLRLWRFHHHSVTISLRYYVLLRRMVWYMSTNLSDKQHTLPVLNINQTVFFLWRCGPTRATASSFLRFLDHKQQRITVGRTPLGEWSARRRLRYPTTHNTHNRQTSMPPVGFETTISAVERP